MIDWYALFKLLHVFTAIAWVGGGMTLLVSNMLSMRAKGDAAVLQSLETMNGLGKVWFVPASLLTVVFGAIAATLGNNWSELWILIGLAGFAWTFLTGILFIEPTGKKIAGMMQAGDVAGGIKAGERLLRIARFDYTVMVVVVADMVLKPQFGDVWVPAAFVLLLIAGAVAFLLPLFRTPVAA